MKKPLLDSLRFQQNSNIQRRISHSVKTLKRLKPSVCLVSIYTLCPAWILLICVNVLMKDAALSVDSHYIFYHIILLVFCWLLIAQQILLFTPWPLALSTNHSAKCSSANISIGCRLTRRRIQMQHSAKQKSMRQ